MSTFKGILQEFPDIRIDYFRHNPQHRPPLACFLSHIHSDHLAGLESLRSPFIYCSGPTKSLLLKLEKYQHRANFERGILESRQRNYRHLKKLLKPIPLLSPTLIELEPENDIQVTLFDANHCPGAVMFLIERNDKAILYTGDVRCEPWFVNSIIRNPFMVAYRTGIKRLDCLYLDTSNIKPISFPSKDEGLAELLSKVLKYPKDTVFHFASWTFGYEEVWMALSHALNSQIHVDKYKMNLYTSLSPYDASALIGFPFRNAFQPGCLTSDPSVRIHSCAKEANCPSLNAKTVWIRPIITRTGGEEVREVGVGGGLGDLTERSVLEVNDADSISKLLNLFQHTGVSSVADIRQLLINGLESPGKSVPLTGLNIENDDGVDLAGLMEILLQLAKHDPGGNVNDVGLREAEAYNGLPRIITFPYSRHSSYEELCHLIREFNPKDIYPCTVDEANWNEGVSMEMLFGHACSTATFRHDVEMRELQSSQRNDRIDLTTPTSSQSVVDPEQLSNRSEVSAQMIPRPEPSTPYRTIRPDLPSSDSQRRRRRAILDDLGESPAKRIRFDVDGPNSSPVPEMPRNQSAVLQGESVNNAGSTVLRIQPEQFRLDNTQQSTASSSTTQSKLWIRTAFWDRSDEIWRCNTCGQEILTDFWPCDICDPERSVLFWEEIDYGSKHMFTSENLPDGALEAVSREITGLRYLDYDSSAYDSHDEKKHEEDQYEINSFIDDSAQEAWDECGKSYEQLCEQDDLDSLSSSSSSSESKGTESGNNPENLVVKNDSGKRDFVTGIDDGDGDGSTEALRDDNNLKFTEEIGDLLTQFDGCTNEDRDVNILRHNGFILGGSTPELPVNHGCPQQVMEYEPGEIAGEEAFAAALGTGGRTWHDISLITTTNNHTYEEVEL